MHIRLTGMENCAFILMSSLPFAWTVVGCLLLVLLLILSVLFVLKSREVATLKRQCEELRETMRMMRYEEANLARMLHTASKPAVRPEVQGEEQDGVQEKEQECESEVVPPVALPGCSEIVEEHGVSSDMPESLGSTESFESLETPELEAPEAEDSSSSPEPEELATPVVEIAHPQKQPINERRPAIPTDLFAAWFAENEEEQDEVSGGLAGMVEDAIAESSMVEEPAGEVPAVEEIIDEVPVVAVAEDFAPEAAVVEETMAEEPTVETPVAELTVVQDVAAIPAAEELQSEEPSRPTELSKEDERFCRKLERIVNTRLRNPNLNIDIIAAQFGIGRTNFYHKVRELTGMSPNDYLRKCRMERAAELLRTSETAISEVCAQVGIPDAQYFSRVFKSYFGTTPSLYRENNNK